MSNINMPGGSKLTPEQKAAQQAEHAKKMAELRARYGEPQPVAKTEDTIASRYSNPEVKIEPRKV
jgi:hypothetical protein